MTFNNRLTLGRWSLEPPLALFATSILLPAFIWVQTNPHHSCRHHFRQNFPYSSWHNFLSEFSWFLLAWFLSEFSSSWLWRWPGGGENLAKLSASRFKSGFTGCVAELSIGNMVSFRFLFLSFSLSLHFGLSFSRQSHEFFCASILSMQFYQVNIAMLHSAERGSNIDECPRGF